jgi:hypothetical protein
MRRGEPNVCPCCGRPHTPEFLVHGALRVRIVAFIAKRPDGITMGELIDLAYGDRPNGEPEWSENSLRTLIRNANRELLPQGYVIRAHRGPGARYYMLPTKHHYPDKHYHGTAGMLSSL